jgi:outer membrane lipoprotein-sorting protein
MVFLGNIYSIIIVLINRDERKHEENEMIKKAKKTAQRRAAFITIIFWITASLLTSSPFSFQDITGEEIIQKVDDLLNTQTAYAKMEMTIETTSGQKRTFLYESWMKDEGEKNLIRYLEPSRVKDQAVLMLNNANDIWMFFPRTQRVRKLATHAKKQKMQGSDFSYEDMGGGGEFEEDFEAKRLQDEQKNGHDCYKVELIRKPESNISYSRLLIWVIKENFYPIVIEYYDEEDPAYLQKTLTQSDIEVIDGIPTAKKMVMQNLNDQTQTVMEVVEIEYDVELDDRMFTERSLKR